MVFNFLNLQYGRADKVRAEELERERLKKMMAAGIIETRSLGIKPHLPPAPRISKLTLAEKETVALRLMDKKAYKKFEKLQKKKMKAERKAKIAREKLKVARAENGGLSDRQLKKEDKKKRYSDLKLLKVEQQQNVPRGNANGLVEVDTDGVLAAPMEPENSIKMFSENRRQEAVRQQKVESIQEMERKRHPNQRSFLDPVDPEPKKRTHVKETTLFTEKNEDTFIEVFDDTGRLISVNGIALDYQGMPVNEESLDSNGNLVSINGVPVEDIPGFTGKVIRDVHGNMISMFGAPSRELIRDGNGKLLYLNGKEVDPRYEEVEGAFQMIKEMTEKSKGGRRGMLDTLAKTLGVSKRSTDIQSALLKQVRRQYKQHKRDLKREAQTAKLIKRQIKQQQQSIQSDNRGKVSEPTSEVTEPFVVRPVTVKTNNLEPPVSIELDFIPTSPNDPPPTADEIEFAQLAQDSKKWAYKTFTVKDGQDSMKSPRKIESSQSYSYSGTGRLPERYGFEKKTKNILQRDQEWLNELFVEDLTVLQKRNPEKAEWEGAHQRKLQEDAAKAKALEQLKKVAEVAKREISNQAKTLEKKQIEVKEAIKETPQEKIDESNANQHLQILVQPQQQDNKVNCETNLQQQSSKQPQESFQKPAGSFQKPPESPQKLPESPQKTPESHQKQLETSQKPSETFQKPLESLQKPQPETSKEPQESFKQHQESFKQPQESFKQPQESLQQPHENSKQPPKDTATTVVKDLPQRLLEQQQKEDAIFREKERQNRLLNPMPRQENIVIGDKDLKQKLKHQELDLATREKEFKQKLLLQKQEQEMAIQEKELQLKLALQKQQEDANRDIELKHQLLQQEKDDLFNREKEVKQKLLQQQQESEANRENEHNGKLVQQQQQQPPQQQDNTGNCSSTPEKSTKVMTKQDIKLKKIEDKFQKKEQGILQKQAKTEYKLKKIEMKEKGKQLEKELKEKAKLQEQKLKEQEKEKKAQKKAAKETKKHQEKLKKLEKKFEKKGLNALEKQAMDDHKQKLSELKEQEKLLKQELKHPVESTLKEKETDSPKAVLKAQDKAAKESKKQQDKLQKLEDQLEKKELEIQKKQHGLEFKQKLSDIKEQDKLLEKELNDNEKALKNKKAEDQKVDKAQEKAAKKLDKNQEKLQKLEDKLGKKKQDRLEKQPEKENKQKLADLKEKDKQQEKELKEKDKIYKSQLKEKEKQDKSLDKQAKESLKLKSKQENQQKKISDKQAQNLGKQKQRENELKLQNMKELQKAEERRCELREKEINTLKILQEKTDAQEKKSAEKERKLLDKQVKQENKEKLEKMKMLQKEEERATKVREKVIAELEKQAKKEAAEELNRIKKEQNIAEKEDQKLAKKKLKDMKEEQKTQEKQAKEREKEIEKLEKERVKRALEEFKKMQRDGKVEEKAQEKEARLRLRTMRQQQVLVEREAKCKANDIAVMERQQEKLAAKEDSAMKKEELQKNKEAKKQLNEKLKKAKEEQKKQEKEAKEKLKEIEKAECEQGKVALKELEKLRKEGKIFEKRADKEAKSNLLSLKSKQKQYEETAKKQLKEIEKLESEDIKNAEKELAKIKNEGKYQESEAEKLTKMKIKTLKEQQKQKDKEVKDRAKEVSALEKLENKIKIQEAMMADKSDRVKKLNQFVEEKKVACAEKERLKNTVADVLKNEILDGETAQELQQIGEGIEQIETERDQLHNEKEKLNEIEEIYQQKKDELRVKTDGLVEDLPEEWRTKIQELRTKMEQKKQETLSVQGKLLSMKESHNKKTEIEVALEDNINKMLDENLNPDAYKKINKLKQKKESILAAIMEAQSKLQEQDKMRQELASKEDDLKEQEDDIIDAENSDLKPLRDLRLVKEDHVNKIKVMNINMGVINIEEENLKEQLRHVKLQEELLRGADGENAQDEIATLKSEALQIQSILDNNKKEASEIKEQIQAEVTLKETIEAKEQTFVNENLSKEGKKKLKELAAKRRDIEKDNEELEWDLSEARNKEIQLKKDLNKTHAEEEETVNKNLEKEAKQEYKRLQQQLKNEQKEIKQKEKEIAKAMKLQEKTKFQKQALKKKEEKILQKETTKETKEKLKKIKNEKKQHEALRKKKEQDEAALQEKEMAAKKKEKQLREKEEKLLESNLTREAAEKVKQLKKEEKEKKKLEKQLAKDLKVLEKAKEKEDKKLAKNKTKKIELQAGNSKLKRLESEQQKYKERKLKLADDLKTLQEKVDHNDQDSSDRESHHSNSDGESHDIKEQSDEDSKSWNKEAKKSYLDDIPGGSKFSDDYDSDTAKDTGKKGYHKKANAHKNVDGDETQGNSVEKNNSEDENNNTDEGHDDNNENNSSEGESNSDDENDSGGDDGSDKDKDKGDDDTEVEDDTEDDTEDDSSDENNNKPKKLTKKRSLKDAFHFLSFDSKDQRIVKKQMKEDWKMRKKLMKKKEKHEDKLRKQMEKNNKKLRKQFYKKAKDQMKIEQFKMRDSMCSDIKSNKAMKKMTKTVGKEMAKMLTSSNIENSSSKGDGSKNNKNNNLISASLALMDNKKYTKEENITRNAIMHKLENADEDRLALKNRIESLTLELKACEESNKKQVEQFEAKLNLERNTVNELSGYQDNTVVLMQQIQTLHQQLNGMVTPAEFDKMAARLNNLNKRVHRFKNQRDALLREKHLLDEKTDILQNLYDVEKNQKLKQEDRADDALRMLNQYRKKVVKLQQKIDTMAEKASQEQRRILFEFDYKVNHGEYKNDSTKVSKLKDQLIQLELLVSEQNHKLAKHESLGIKEQHCSDVMDEIHIQLERLGDTDRRYKENRTILNEKYEKQQEKAAANRLREYNVSIQAPSKEHYQDSQILKKQLADVKKREKALNKLIQQKDEIISTLALNKNSCCTTSQEKHQHSEGRQCEHFSTPKPDVGKQLAYNPDAEKPLSSKNNMYDQFIAIYKKQKLQMKELGRGIEILQKEVKVRFCKQNMKTKPVVERIADNVAKMSDELKDIMERIKLDESAALPIGIVTDEDALKG